jgi:hypothetical protein
MSAIAALKAARAAGVELALDGDDLALKAASAPPAAVLDALSRHKAEIMVQPELIVRPHEKVICRQTAMSNLPSDFDYSATNNGAIDGALCR